MLFLSTNYVFSVDWYANENKGFFIDKESLIKTENSIKAWVMYIANGKIKNMLILHNIWKQVVPTKLWQH